MKLFVTGGTGFIGAPLCRRLAEQGHELTVVTRRPFDSGPRVGRGPIAQDAAPTERPWGAPPQAAPAGPSGIRFVSWDGEAWRRSLAEAEGVINLAGESIAAGRWTPQRKQQLRESRVDTTRRLIDALEPLSDRPAVLVSASAVGYYGPRGDEELGESDPPGEGFLPDLCRAWEAQAMRAEAFRIRVVRLRIGVVLAAGGGALAKMAPPFLAYVGGPLGSGRQWMSWIHREDLIGLIAWALRDGQISGPVNATAPQPATMRQFASHLGDALRRPSWAPVPAGVLRLMLGEMAQMLVTGQRVMPRAALAHGFTFRHPELGEALQDCLSK